MIPLNPSDLIWFFDGQDARLVPIGEVFPGQTNIKKTRHAGPLHLTSLRDYSHDGVRLTRLDLFLLFGKGLPHRPLHFLLSKLAIGQDFINHVIFLINKLIHHVRAMQVFSSLFSRYGKAGGRK